MNWKISIESERDTFTETGETFIGSMDDVNLYLEHLRDTTGKCHSATLVQ